MEFWIPFLSLIALASVLIPLMRKSPPPGKSANAYTAEAKVDEATLSCTCEEWRMQRAKFRQGDPRRLCNHLCAHLGADILRVPENLMPFSQLIVRMHEEGKGIDYPPPSFAFVLGDTGYMITMKAQMHPWATVYVGHSDYAFNVDNGQWSEHGRPPFASDIGSLIQAEIVRRTREAGEKQRRPSKAEEVAEGMPRQ